MLRTCALILAALAASTLDWSTSRNAAPTSQIEIEASVLAAPVP